MIQPVELNETGSRSRLNQTIGQQDQLIQQLREELERQKRMADGNRELACKQLQLESWRDMLGVAAVESLLAEDPESTGGHVDFEENAEEYIPCHTWRVIVQECDWDIKLTVNDGSLALWCEMKSCPEIQVNCEAVEVV